MYAQLPQISPQLPAGKDKYVSVDKKFWICHFFAFIWMLFSIIVSIPWVKDLGNLVSIPVAILIIAGIGYIPGYLICFIVFSIILDRQPSFKTLNPIDSLTIIIPCRNEEHNIEKTLQYIKNQDYEGEIFIIVVDNGSTDNTANTAIEAGKSLNLKLKVLSEDKPGKSYALNNALNYAETDYIITLDADTLLHKSSVRYIMSRMKSSPKNVCAVAGAVLVRNSRQTLMARLQEWVIF
ncbi:glycosyltransferase family 2 protein [Aceticella autotrophica]|uniref:glycosyltransferase family 2 protein n=1 Tax=Aceticella autotrophica TaxID=2755338 RepID=UPI002543EC33|nr:glycosyltransferase family 2 protein [Aceticella autotrophica]